MAAYRRLSLSHARYLKIGHMFTNYGSLDCKRENFPKRGRVH